MQAVKRQAELFATTQQPVDRDGEGSPSGRGLRSLKDLALEIQAHRAGTPDQPASSVDRIPRHRSDAIAAALAGGEVEPHGLQQTLYLLLSVTSALQAHGDPASQQLGAILPMTLEMLIGEIQFLLSLLALTSGNASPHLRCALPSHLAVYEGLA